QHNGSLPRCDICSCETSIHDDAPKWDVVGHIGRDLLGKWVAKMCVMVYSKCDISHVMIHSRKGGKMKANLHCTEKFCPNCEKTLPIADFYFYAKLSRYNSWCL